MAKFGRKTYGGDRPVCTNQPVMVAGGFNLDLSVHSFDAGAIIPAGTLAVYDESSRTVKVLKTGKVKAIGSDTKEVTLESSMFLKPVFKTGDKVLKTVSGTLENAPSISKIEVTNGEYIITLSDAISGLAVGDVIVQVVADATTPTNAALIGTPSAVVIVDTEVNESSVETGIDISVDSGNGAWYARRIPAIPAGMVENNHLKANPNIKFTQSF